MSKYTKFGIGAAALLAAAGLAACDAGDPEPATASRDAIITETPIEANTGAASRDIDETIYLAALDNGGVAYTSDDEAVAAGYAVCLTLDEGHALEALMIAFATADERMSPAISNTDAGFVAGAAITQFCPEHSGQMDQFIADWSN